MSSLLEACLVPTSAFFEFPGSLGLSVSDPSQAGQNLVFKGARAHSALGPTVGRWVRDRSGLVPGLEVILFIPELVLC